MQLHHQQLFHLPAISRLLEAQQQRQRLKALALLVKANQQLSPQKKARQQKQASQRLQQRFLLLHPKKARHRLHPLLLLLPVSQQLAERMLQMTIHHPAAPQLLETDSKKETTSTSVVSFLCLCKKQLQIKIMYQAVLHDFL